MKMGIENCASRDKVQQIEESLNSYAHKETVAEVREDLQNKANKEDIDIIYSQNEEIKKNVGAFAT